MAAHRYVAAGPAARIRIASSKVLCSDYLREETSWRATVTGFGLAERSSKLARLSSIKLAVLQEAIVADAEVKAFCAPVGGRAT
jgi:hypothetical protein